MNTLQLDFSNFKIRLEEKALGLSIFDPIRERWIVLTPEEEVRQWLIHYLVQEKNFPMKCIGVERQLLYNGKPKRFDMLVFDGFGKPVMLIELKRPGVGIGQSALDQITRYNHILRVPYILVFNGYQLILCHKATDDVKYQYLTDIPDYGSLSI